MSVSYGVTDVAVIEWWLHITSRRLMPRNALNTAKTRNKKTQADDRLSADAETATHFCWVVSDD